MRFNDKVLAFLASIEGKQIAIGKDKYMVENLSNDHCPSYIINHDGHYHATVFIYECSDDLLSVGTIFMGSLVRSKVLISNITVLEGSEKRDVA